MAEDMQTMMSLMLAEMREMRSEMQDMRSEFGQRFDRIEKKLELHDTQLTALINGQTVLTNSIADVKNTLSAKIDETQKDNKVSKEISRDMLYDIAELKKKVK